MTPYLLAETRNEQYEDEVKLLSFAGYLAWLGQSAGTVRQHVFAVQAAHKRAGAGDPLKAAPRVILLLDALRRANPPRPRKLGVTPEMLEWISSELRGDRPRAGLEASRGATANREVIQAAILFGFFYMCRASEYLHGMDAAKVLRGVDVDIRD
jgi:hypothetical protein